MKLTSAEKKLWYKKVYRYLVSQGRQPKGWLQCARMLETLMPEPVIRPKGWLHREWAIRLFNLIHPDGWADPGLGVCKATRLPKWDLEVEAKRFYHSAAWRKLRYETLLRFGRKCQCCGATPPEVVIHVDHIRPLRKFWSLRLDPDNVQVLCEGCNHGKGNGPPVDLRPQTGQCELW